MLAFKQFAFASFHHGWSPSGASEVRTSQILEGCVRSKGPGTPENISFSNDDSIAIITVCDSYGVWSVGTNTDSPAEDSYNNPFLRFHTRRGQDSLQVVQLNGYKEVIVWDVSVEDPLALHDRLEKSESPSLLCVAREAREFIAYSSSSAIPDSLKSVAAIHVRQLDIAIAAATPRIENETKPD